VGRLDQHELKQRPRRHRFRHVPILPGRRAWKTGAIASHDPEGRARFS
jgi:hypothetical protein